MSRDEAGTVLVESLVGVAVVALMLVALGQTLGQDAARQRAVADRRTAVLIAQSELAAVGSAIPLSPGRTSGEQDDYVWQVDVEAASGEDAAISDAGGLESVVVSVHRRDQPGVLARLHTLRLAPVA